MIIRAPSKTGHWKLRMLTVGSAGLKITDTLDVKVTSTLEVDVRTPVEINVGETVQTDIYVANNVNSCMDVRRNDDCRDLTIGRYKYETKTNRDLRSFEQSDFVFISIIDFCNFFTPNGFRFQFQASLWACVQKFLIFSGS